MIKDFLSIYTTGGPANVLSYPIRTIERIVIPNKNNRFLFPCFTSANNLLFNHDLVFMHFNMPKIQFSYTFCQIRLHGHVAITPYHVEWRQ